MSNLNVKPLGSGVLVNPDEQKDQNTSGIYIPQQGKPIYGTILRIGEQVREVAVGERVMYRPNAGVSTKALGKIALVMDESDLIAVIENN